MGRIRFAVGNCAFVFAAALGMLLLAGSVPLLSAAMRAQYHVPVRCMSKVDFSGADCRQQKRLALKNGRPVAIESAMLDCNHVLVAADCIEPGPRDPGSGTLLCRGAQNVK